MSRKTVGVDVDGVLANLAQNLLDHINARHDMSLTEADLLDYGIESMLPPEKRDGFWDEIRAIDHHSSMRLYDGAQEGFTKLCEAFDVYIITTPMDGAETWTHNRERWLAQRFNVPSHKIVHTAAKYLCGVDALIDDHIVNIDKWKKRNPNGTSILWRRPWNGKGTQHADHHINDWTQAMDILKALP